MSSIDVWRVVTVVLVVAGVCGTVIGGVAFLKALEINDHDYKMTGGKTVDEPPRNSTRIHDYENLSAESRSAFDDLRAEFDSEGYRVSGSVFMSKDRARHLENTTQFALWNKTYVRYDGEIYDIQFTDREERAPGGLLGVLFAVTVLLPAGIGLSGGLLYLRRRNA